MHAADHFEMLPSDTDPSIIAPFQILESDIPPQSASQETIYDGNSSAGSDLLETGPDEAVIFRDDSTASSASIINNGGQTRFEDRTTAASSSLTANEDGYIRFSAISTAADSRVVINEGGRVDFDEDATAGSAFITNNAYLRFGDSATAANAEVTVNEDGVLAFRNIANAGIARITNNGLTGFFASSSLAGSIVTNNNTGFLLFADDANAGTTSFIGNNGTVAFTGRSTLGDGAITNNAMGIVRFEDSANAGTGFISSSGALIFTDQSSAAGADIVGNLGGLILFRDNSTAGSATIAGAANLRFAGSASAGSASITMAPGTILSFVESANGGTAQVQLDAGSSLEIASAIHPVNLATLSGAGNISLGANTLVFGDNTPLVSFAGNIDDAARGGGLVKRGSGVVNLSGQSSYTGATIVSAGTLESGGQNVFSSRSAFTVNAGAELALTGFNQQVGSLAGAGLVDLAAGSILTTGGNGASTIFSGTISGSGGISKIGAGQFTLAGTSTYSGDTLVNAGRLRVDGDIASSSVAVGEDGTLLGQGRVGSTAIFGTLLGEPNGAALTIAGDLTLSGRATTALELSGERSGLFNVDGVAQLDGTLTILPSETIVPNHRYVFLTAGLVAGTYDRLQSDFAFLDPVVTYGPTFAALELARNAVAFSSVGQTPNQRATATAIENLGTGNGVFDTVLPLSEAGAQTAFDNLSGEAHATLLAAASVAQGAVRRTVLHQIGSETRSNVWGVAQGGTSKLSSDGNGAEASFDDASLIGGTDIVSTDNFRFGLYGYLGYSDFTLDERVSHGMSRYAGAGIYSGWNEDRWRIRGTAAISYDALKLIREISVGMLNGTARSDYAGWTGSAAVDLGYALETETFNVEPYAGLDYSYTRTGGFSEEGAGAANLSSGGSDYSRLDGEIGIRASTSLQLAGGVVVRPSVGIGYIRNLSGATAASLHHFSESGDFEVYAARVNRDSAMINLRIDAAFLNGVDIGAFYRGFLSGDQYNQVFGADLRIPF